MGYLGLEEAERAIKLGAYTQAYEIFVAMVESGEDPAFYKLCEMAIHAQLHEDQQKDFADRLERAVRQDNESATYNMAVLYSRGVVFERDLQKAAHLFSKACACRVPEAFAALAKLYIHHRHDLPLASSDNIVQLLHDGIKLGSAESAYLMGRICTTGGPVRADPFEAVKYLYAAARLGHEEAKKALVMIQTMNPSETFASQQKEGTDLYWRMKNPDLHSEHRSDD